MASSREEEIATFVRTYAPAFMSIPDDKGETATNRLINMLTQPPGTMVRTIFELGRLWEARESAKLIAQARKATGV
jgi:hypothetical protein